MAATEKSDAIAPESPAQISHREWAAFDVALDGIIASVRGGQRLATALVADWIERERQRDYGEVGECRRKCPDGEREYWDDKARRVKGGLHWGERSPRTGSWGPTVRPNDDLAKAVRACAIRDFRPDSAHEMKIHPQKYHYVPDLVNGLRMAQHKWPAYLKGLLDTLSGELRRMAGAYANEDRNGGTPAYCESPVEGVSASDPCLSPSQRNCLEALLQLKAFDSDTLVPQSEILAEISAGGDACSAETLRDAVTDLKVNALVQTRRGSGGGCWLTPTGQARAERIAKP